MDIQGEGCILVQVSNNIDAQIKAICNIFECYKTKTKVVTLANLKGHTIHRTNQNSK